MRVVFASDVEATKLTGAPSCDRNMGAGGSFATGAAVVVAGVGAVFGTRWNAEHAPTPNATNATRSDEM